MTCSRRTGRETVTFVLDEPLDCLVYATKLKGKYPYRVVRGIVDPGHSILNVRGEYVKLDECDGQAGRERGKRYRDYKHGGEDAVMKQGGQQEDDGWVMVQRMRGRGVADDNGVGCTGTV